MQVDETLIKAEMLIHSNDLEDAEILLASIDGEMVPGYWFLKGLLKQKAHQWGEAVNCYNRCLDLDPDHDRAAAGIGICKSILDFWNPSLFNP